MQYRGGLLGLDRCLSRKLSTFVPFVHYSMRSTHPSRTSIGFCSSDYKRLTFSHAKYKDIKLFGRVWGSEYGDGFEISE
jgi:hypothetical protein